MLLTIDKKLVQTLNFMLFWVDAAWKCVVPEFEKNGKGKDLFGNIVWKRIFVHVTHIHECLSNVIFRIHSLRITKTEIFMHSMKNTLGLELQANLNFSYSQNIRWNSILYTLCMDTRVYEVNISRLWLVPLLFSSMNWVQFSNSFNSSWFLWNLFNVLSVNVYSTIDAIQ